jgi:uncharacterized protein
MDFFFPMKRSAFQVMLKPVGPACNLNCTYCYYLEKKNLYPYAKGYRLKDDLLENFIKEYIKSQDVPVVSFVWQGGEPTMLGLEYFKKAFELQKKYADGKRIENALQTNGTLLTDEFCEFLRENTFLVGLSIDGPRELHDHYRVTVKGEPSWERVMGGVKLLKKHSVEFNTLSVVNNKTSEKPVEVYRFLKGIGSRFMQFIPIVERYTSDPGEEDVHLVHHQYKGEAEVTDWSVVPSQYGTFMIKIFDEWVRRDVGRFYVQLFDVTLANWMGESNPGLCVFSETCGDAAVMEHNGDLYSCDHFVYHDYHLGNIKDTPLIDMMQQERQARFGLEKRTTLPPYCLECEFRFACHGECPKHRFSITPDGDRGLNYLCEAYKMFFGHVKPYMDYMAKQLNAKKPPANVMQWIKQKEQPARPAGLAAGRNDPCPCGSGKKYKQCCLKLFR